MKLSFLSSIVLGSAVALTLSACSGGGGGGGGPAGNVFTPKPLPPGYDESQCGSYCPDIGNAALYANLGVDRPVTSDLFDKRYNRATLEAVLEASILETQKYAAQDGIFPFKIPRTADDKRFPYQYALDDVPDPLRPAWDASAKGDTDSSYLDGLFFVAQGRRVVLVREDAGRWTLVHEMMHANFYRQRVLDGTPSEGSLKSSINSNLNQIGTLLNDYQQTTQQKDLSDAADLAAVLPDWQVLMLGQHTLEEVAVESLLGEEYRANRLKYVHPEAIYSSKAYIEANIGAASPDIDQLETTLKALKDKVFAAGLADSASELDTAIAKCEALKSRLAQLLALAKKMSDDAQTHANPKAPVAALAGLFQTSAPRDEAAILSAARQNARAAAKSPAQQAFRDGLKKLKQALQN